jgi:formyl-CoA transferase
MLALRASERDGVGQVVDVAITESVFALTEAMLTEYKHAGVIREREGNSMLRAAPSNVYQTKDGHWLAIGGNGENVFRRLALAMGQARLANDERFHNNRARVKNHRELDKIISAWVASLTLPEAQTALDEAGVPAGPVMSIADIAADPQYQARGMIAAVPDTRMPEDVTYMAGIIPRLTETPGAIRHSGGDLGADNQAIYSDLLGLDPQEMQRLQKEGVL